MRFPAMCGRTQYDKVDDLAQSEQLAFPHAALRNGKAVQWWTERRKRI